MNQSRPASRAVKFPCLARFQWFSRLVAIVLLTAATSLPAQTQTPDDQYLGVLALVDRADTLNEKKQGDLGKAKYTQAARVLQQFRLRYPTWNPKVVSFRLNYLTDKITVLSQTNPPPAAVTGEGGTATATATSAGAGKQVKLLDAGAEPRQALRFQVQVGDQQTIVTSVKTKRDVAGNSMAEPTRKISLTVTVKDVAASGDITYDITVDDVSLEEGPDVNPMLLVPMKAIFEKLKALSLTAVVTSRGLGRSVTANTAGADAQTKQIIDQVKDSLAGGTIPLPEEPIGVGAKWDVKRSVKLQGLSANETTALELVSVDGDNVQLKSVTSQTATNQKLELPGAAGMKMDVTKMAGKGTGTSTVSLKKLLPLKTSSTMHSELSAAMNLAGQKQTMTIMSDESIVSEAK